ncbi:MAG: prenyltransferase/squalene oxidase repeat-containing protein [Verrucomicrobiota bacterium]
MITEEFKRSFSYTRSNAAKNLLDARCKDGSWSGFLSSSALATATATVALQCVDSHDHAGRIRSALNWLIENQNKDGGWGDTPISKSNLSTTLLTWAAFRLVGVGPYRRELTLTETYIKKQIDGLEPDKIVHALEQRYGKDKTFSIPILTLCAICGCLGSDKEAWNRVRQLPFELSILPHKCFEMIRLPVVSYALPALIAMGIVRFNCGKNQHSLMWPIRKILLPFALRKLTRIQPKGGGFLEAIPLTSFVTMSLVTAGYNKNNTKTIANAIPFLIDSQRDDGSWPIDSNLNTWVTTLSINALASGGKIKNYLKEKECTGLRKWLEKQQFEEVHPYTNANPGGWAWTPLSGGVPDADDTSGALISLRHLGSDAERIERGIQWLLDLQNEDGGVPTFCRGWGTLPFDRSCPDITAHAIRVFDCWYNELKMETKTHSENFAQKALNYLFKSQEKEGSWQPLWFGNEHTETEENPVYGTSRVVLACAEAGIKEFEIVKACKWLCEIQNKDGSWGGNVGTPGSIEETSLAVEAISSFYMRDDKKVYMEAVIKGIHWLNKKTQNGQVFQPSPIGLYFARLWYYEEMYPLIYLVAAYERASMIIK